MQIVPTEPTHQHGLINSTSESWQMRQRSFVPLSSERTDPGPQGLA